VCPCDRTGAVVKRLRGAVGGRRESLGAIAPDDCGLAMLLWERLPGLLAGLSCGVLEVWGRLICSVRIFVQGF
jgi:hypothetical protein